MSENTLVIPGKYIRLRWWHVRKTLVGIRRFDRIYIPQYGVEAKLYDDITDKNRCQRGPDGKPLHKMTPFVRFTTRADWAAAEAAREKA